MPQPSDNSNNDPEPPRVLAVVVATVVGAGLLAAILVALNWLI